MIPIHVNIEEENQSPYTGVDKTLDASLIGSYSGITVFGTNSVVLFKESY